MPQPKCLKHLFRERNPPFRIYMYSEAFDRHHEPHVHVVWGDHDEVVIALRDLHVLEPEALTRRFPLKQVMTILRDHQVALMEEWDETLERTRGR